MLGLALSVTLGKVFGTRLLPNFIDLGYFFASATRLFNICSHISIFIFVFVVVVVVRILLLLVVILTLNHFDAFATLACVLAYRNFLFVNKQTA